MQGNIGAEIFHFIRFLKLTVLLVYCQYKTVRAQVSTCLSVCSLSCLREQGLGQVWGVGVGVNYIGQGEKGSIIVTVVVVGIVDSNAAKGLG